LNYPCIDLILKSSYYDITVCYWFVVVWDYTVEDLLIIVKSSKLIDSICKDGKVTFMEVSGAIIYPLVTNYIIAYEEKFVFNIDYSFLKQ
jgi:hypothetical protein